MIILSATLLLKSYPATLQNHFLLPIFLGIALFRPTIVTLHNGQLAALLLLTITFTVYFWEKDKWWQGSVFLPFLALKPNLGVPLLLLLSFYLVIRRQIAALVFGGLCGLALLLAGLAQNPDWIMEFWKAGNTKLSQIFGFSPTVWGLSAFFCQYEIGCTIRYGGFVCLILLIVFVFYVAKNGKTLSPTLVTGFAITVMLLVTPSAWPYDQLLLVLPILTVTMNLAKNDYPFLPVALIFLALDALAFLLLGISASIEREYWNAIVPLFVFFLLTWFLSMKRPMQPNADGA
jgi:hypothetical protein